MHTDPSVMLADRIRKLIHDQFITNAHFKSPILVCFVFRYFRLLLCCCHCYCFLLLFSFIIIVLRQCAWCTALGPSTDEYGSTSNRGFSCWVKVLTQKPIHACPSLLLLCWWSKKACFVPPRYTSGMPNYMAWNRCASQQFIFYSCNLRLCDILGSSPFDSAMVTSINLREFLKVGELLRWRKLIIGVCLSILSREGAFKGSITLRGDCVLRTFSTAGWKDLFCCETEH